MHRRLFNAGIAQFSRATILVRAQVKTPRLTLKRTAYMNGNEFTVASLTTSLHATVPGSSDATWPAASSATNHFVLATKSPLRAAESKKLKELSVNFKEYLSDNTWLCRYEPTDITTLLKQPFVADVKPVPPHLKIHPYFEIACGKAPNKPWTVDIVLHDGEASSVQTLSKQIQRLVNVDQSNMQIRHEGPVIRLTVGGDKLHDIAAVNSVRCIEEVRPLVLDRCRMI